MYKTAEQIADLVLTKLAYGEQPYAEEAPGVGAGMGGAAGGLAGGAAASIAGGAALGGVAGLGVGGTQLYRKMKADPRLHALSKEYASNPQKYRAAGSTGNVERHFEKGITGGSGKPLTVKGPVRKAFTRNERLVGRVGNRLRKGIRRKGLLGLGLGAAAAGGAYLATRD